MARASHFVRVGLSGPCRSIFVAQRRGRGPRDIASCVEPGEVWRSAWSCVIRAAKNRPVLPDGVLLRRVTLEDDLLLARLERDREQAFAQCAELLSNAAWPVTLVDVEHLFDGRSLFFYFLGNVTPEVDALTQELARDV